MRLVASLYTVGTARTRTHDLEFELTYVFISHDLSVVRYIADDVMVMYYGEAVEYGSRDEVFADPKRSYTRTLFAATPRADVASIKARLAKKKAA
ncbi:hypothetical protein MES4922_190408 [Mesorhizobium ventifaucium]|uniref:Oligopeptide/dipeptide ABC transporter C-terminal domain-containing protein n=1 Tax=Mesorhizobium ventifaucium TaxID=666020 RepID=A0ABM9DP37_9HYPH|nr:hypothetical protein MES4922_190408 [Mesorhizobium ventifaucium]